MRKREVVTVPASWGGRDANKNFVVTEMPATRAEKWAWRLMIAVKGTTAEVPQEVAALGMVGVAIRGLNAFLASDVDFAKLEPLLDEMMTCVTVVRDLQHPDVATPIVSDDDVEEVRTVAWLRSEVLRVHTGFSAAEAFSRIVSAINSEEGPPDAAS